MDVLYGLPQTLRWYLSSNIIKSSKYFCPSLAKQEWLVHISLYVSQAYRYANIFQISFLLEILVYLN